MNKKIFIAAVLIFTVGVSSAEVTFDKALNFFQPAKEFTGISLNSSIKDVKQLGFSCKESTDVINGKVFNFTDCLDEKYRADIFGLSVDSRQIIFVDGKFGAIKTGGFAQEGFFEVLRKKLDTVYKQTRTSPSEKSPGKVYWDFGSGAILILESSYNFKDGKNLLFSMAVASPIVQSLMKK